MLHSRNTVLVVLLCLSAGLLGCSQEQHTSVENNVAKDAPKHANSQATKPATESLIDECKENGKKQLMLARATVSDLQNVGELTQLEVLEIYQSDFESGELTRIKDLVGLKRLKLEDLAIDDTSVDVLSEFTQLEVLNLPAARLTDDGFRKLVSNLPELILLRIGGVQLSDSGIASVSSLPRLRFLHLINVPITDAGLKTFHDMHDLESLYIDGDSATDNGIRDLLRANPQLHFHRNQSHFADDPNADGH